MHSTGSMLYTILERVRAYSDDPDIDAKYSEDWIIRHIITPSLVDVQGRLSLFLDNPVYNRLALNIVANQEFYTLPPCVGEVVRLGITDAQGTVTTEWTPRGETHPFGPGWTIEGNVLAVRPAPTASGTFTLWYINNGDAMPFFSDVTSTTATTVVVPATPTLGALDRRKSAYVGHMLRLIPNTSTAEIQERIISGYDFTTRTFTVRRDFDPVPSGTHKVEVVPMGHSQALWDAIAFASAIRLCTVRRAPGPQLQALQLNYRSAIKTIGDQLANLNNKRPGGFDRHTVDNPFSQWVTPRDGNYAL